MYVINYKDNQTIFNNLSNVSTGDLRVQSSVWEERLRYVEIAYNIVFFLIGTPINIRAVYQCIKGMQKSSICVCKRLLFLRLYLTIGNLIILVVYCGGRVPWLLLFLWHGGDFTCKMFKFFQSLGYYMWSNAVVVIAFDMYFCLSLPMRVVLHSTKRVRQWLYVATGFAVLCSIPQLVVFGVLEVPSMYIPSNFLDQNNQTKYWQCANKFYMETDFIVAYELFNALTTFYFPLVAILWAYIQIFITMTKSLPEPRSLESMSLRPPLMTTPQPEKGSIQSLNVRIHHSSERSSATSQHMAEVSDRRDLRNYRNGSLQVVKFRMQPDTVSVGSNRRPHNSDRKESEKSEREQLANGSADKDKMVADKRRKMFSRQKTVGRSHDSMEDKDHRKGTRRRLARITVAIISTFILCWTPFQVIGVFSLVCSVNKWSCAFIGYLHWLEGVAILSAILNPIIYDFMSV